MNPNPLQNQVACLNPRCPDSVMISTKGNIDAQCTCGHAVCQSVVRLFCPPEMIKQYCEHALSVVAFPELVDTLHEFRKSLNMMILNRKNAPMNPPIAAQLCQLKLTDQQDTCDTQVAPPTSGTFR